jgi:hypothetical protein
MRRRATRSSSQAEATEPTRRRRTWLGPWLCASTVALLAACFSDKSSSPGAPDGSPIGVTEGGPSGAPPDAASDGTASAPSDAGSDAKMACDAAATTALGVQCLETNGAIPALDRGPDLAGPDTNGDGIRDDVGSYIAGRAYPAACLAAVNRLAQAYQAVNALVESVGDAGLFPPAVGDGGADGAPATPGDAGATTDPTQPASRLILRAISCLYDTAGCADPEVTIDTLRKLTFNTEARVRAFVTYNHARNGSVSTIPRGNTCAN